MLLNISKVVTFQKYSRGLLARKLYERMMDATHTERTSQLSSMCYHVDRLSSSTEETLQQLHKFDMEQVIIIWLHLEMTLKVCKSNALTDFNYLCLR